MTGLARLIEALLFLAPEPVPVEELADALQCSEDDVTAICAAMRAAVRASLDRAGADRASADRARPNRAAVGTPP